MELNNEMVNEAIGEVMTDSAVDAVVTELPEAAASSSGSGLVNVAVVGGLMAAGAVAWEFALKPAAKKVKAGWNKLKEKRAGKQRITLVRKTEPEAADDDFVPEPLDEI